jgi:hypothetical protein
LCFLPFSAILYSATDPSQTIAFPRDELNRFVFHFKNKSPFASVSNQMIMLPKGD